MFSGTWGGGSGGTATLLPSSGGGTWGGTATLLPTTYSYSAPTVTAYPVSYSYSYQNAYTPALPGAGLRAGPFGEHGPYTAIDLPLLRPLREDERLENVSLDPSQASFNTPQNKEQVSLLSCLILGGLLLLVLK